MRARNIEVSYNYQTERPRLFTEEGQILFLDVRDRVAELLKASGAFRFSHVNPKSGGYDSWALIACIDRLVELGEIEQLPRQCWQQFSVYTSPERSLR